MKTCGYLVSSIGMADLLFGAIDAKDHREFTFGDYAHALYTMSSGSPKAKLEFAFSMYDRAKEGYINAAPIAKAIRPMITFLQRLGYSDELLAPIRNSEKLLHMLIGDIDESALAISKANFSERIETFLGSAIDSLQCISLGIMPSIDLTGKMLPVITPGHEQWQFMQNFMIGLPLAIQDTSRQPSTRTIQSHDWGMNTIFDLQTGQMVSSTTLDAGQSMGSLEKKKPYHLDEDADIELNSADRETVNEIYATIGEWTFTDYAPFVFHTLRRYFKVDTDAYLKAFSIANFCAGLMLGSLSNSIQEVVSTGKSGSFILRSSDQSCIIKSLRESEFSYLVTTLLQPYFNHIKECEGNTLLPRFLGLYRLRHIGVADHYLLVMKNSFPRQLGDFPVIDEQFDLKGSTAGRTARAADSKTPLFCTQKKLNL